MTKALRKCYSTQLSEIAAPIGTPWMWTLRLRAPRRSHADLRREAAMAAFAGRWRWQSARAAGGEAAGDVLRGSGVTNGKTRKATPRCGQAAQKSKSKAVSV